MAKKIVSVPKAVTGNVAGDADAERNGLFLKYPVELVLDRIFCKMCDDTARLLNDEERELARNSSASGNSDLAAMALRFIASSMCARCDELDGAEINEASAAVSYLEESLTESHRRVDTAHRLLAKHYARLAGVVGDPYDAR